MNNPLLQLLLRLLAVSFLSLSTLTSCTKKFDYPPPIEEAQKAPSSHSKTTPSTRLSKNTPSFKVGIAPFLFSAQRHSANVIDTRKQHEVSHRSLEILKNYLAKDKRLYIIDDSSLNTLKKHWTKSDLAHLKDKYHYILTGQIKNFGHREIGSSNKILAYSKVYVQLIDINQREVIYAEYSDSQTTEELKKSNNFHYLQDQALHKSVMALAPKISEILLAKPWRTQIIEGYAKDGEDYLVIAAEKDQRLSKGQTLEVAITNKVLKNPLTNTHLTMLAKPLALVEIVDFIPGKPGEGKAVCKVLGEQLQGYINSKSFANLIIRTPSLTQGNE
ncbi:MAG: hypothetical protein L7U87_02935 [Chlamydiales bacterium]|nr:hypothetical protein [Chlamydiales bacterium]